jgi:tetratricopeptide (TPR) repeat protein
MKFGSSELSLAGRGRLPLRLGVILMISILFFTMSPGPSQASSQPASPREAILKEARNLIDRNQTNPQGLRQAISQMEGFTAQFPDEARLPLYLAEAYYRLADPQADVAREFPYYEKTATYAEKALKLAPHRAEGHYWYGLALLKKAQKKGGIRAYFLARKGIEELQKVRQALPNYDHAGASRVLGLLYCLAPQWTPFGDLDKSIRLAQEATRLAPNFPLNRLYLADAYKKRGDKQAAIREYKKILADSTNLPDPQAAGFSHQARASLRSLGYQI